MPAGYSLAALPPPRVLAFLQQQWLAQQLAAQAQTAAALAQLQEEVLVGPAGQYQPYCDQVGPQYHGSAWRSAAPRPAAATLPHHITQPPCALPAACCLRSRPPPPPLPARGPPPCFHALAPGAALAGKQPLSLPSSTPRPGLCPTPPTPALQEISEELNLVAQCLLSKLKAQQQADPGQGMWAKRFFCSIKEVGGWEGVTNLL